jgi:hypothetical protein
MKILRALWRLIVSDDKPFSQEWMDSLKYDRQGWADAPSWKRLGR